MWSSRCWKKQSSFANTTDKMLLLKILYTFAGRWGFIFISRQEFAFTMSYNLNSAVCYENRPPAHPIKKNN